jgi:hypothetical protein
MARPGRLAYFVLQDRRVWLCLQEPSCSDYLGLFHEVVLCLSSRYRPAGLPMRTIDCHWLRQPPQGPLQGYAKTKSSQHVAEPMRQQDHSRGHKNCSGRPDQVSDLRRH